MTEPDWNHYRAFLGALHEGSLSGAARLLGLAQQDETIAARILLDHGAGVDQIRDMAVRVLSGDSDERPPSPSGPRRSNSSVVTVKAEGNWTMLLARKIDEAISRLAEGRELISVAVTPVWATHDMETQRYSSVIWGLLKSSATTSVNVTVVWREDQ